MEKRKDGPHALRGRTGIAPQFTFRNAFVSCAQVSAGSRHRFTHPTLLVDACSQRNFSQNVFGEVLHDFKQTLYDALIVEITGAGKFDFADATVNVKGYCPPFIGSKAVVLAPSLLSMDHQTEDQSLHRHSLTSGPSLPNTGSCAGAGTAAIRLSASTWSIVPGRCWSRCAVLSG